MRIGIVGLGYVGTAVKTIFSEYYSVETYDLNEGIRTCESLDDLVNKTEIIFICVPTPMNKNGSCSLDIVKSVVGDIDVYSKVRKKEKIVVIKSTVCPGTTKDLNKKYQNISVIFNPEFLTEANFISDFRNQNRIIIGGERPALTKLRQAYSLIFPKVTIVETESDTAEMVKYFINSFLATKVSFANEMKMICNKIDIDYDRVVEYAIHDKRLGKSHWAVPGPDGHYGFGGSCFPKDINALIYLCKNINVSPNTLIGAWKTNLNVRPEMDWEKLKGRAVKNDK